MLPDLPSLKADLHHVITLFMRARMQAADPLLQFSTKTIQHEGKTRGFVRQSGEQAGFDYSPITAKYSVKSADMVHLSLRGVFDIIDRMALEMAEQIARRGYARISESSEKAGTAIDFGGRKYDCQAHVEALGRLEIQFDGSRDKPIMPALTATPEFGAQLAGRMAEWEKDPACQALMQTLLNTKYEEWRARQDRKQLVD